MVGAVWILYINADYFSVAVSVGLIALAGVAIETAVISFAILFCRSQATGKSKLIK